MKIRRRALIALGVLAALSLLVAGLVHVSKGELNREARQERKVEREPQRERCAQPAYVKIGQHLLKVPRTQQMYFEKNSKMVSIGCDTTPESPLNVEMMSFVHSTPFPGYVYEHHLPGWSERVSFQLLFYLVPARRRDRLADITADLEREGKGIADLPRDGDFYKYTRTNDHFINADGTLVAPDGRPLLIASCSNPRDALSCDAEFLWQKDLFVEINPIIHPPHVSMDAWKDLYPRVLSELKTFEQQQ